MQLYHDMSLFQSHCRGWLTRRKLLIEKEAVIRIQTAVRSLKYRKAFLHQKHAVLEIQRFARGAITRKRLLGAFIFQSQVSLLTFSIPAYNQYNAWYSRGLLLP